MHPQQQLALALLAYAAQRGLPADDLARHAGLDSAALLNPAHGPLSAPQWQQLWRSAAHLAHDPAFGLHFGEAATPAALGVVGQLVQSSRTVAEALTHAAALLPLLTDHVWLDLAHSPRSVVLRLRYLPASQAAEAAVRAHLLDFLLALSLHELDGLLLVRLQPRRVWLPPGAPQGPEHLRVLRVARLEEGPAGEYGLELGGACWDVPILTASYELQAALLHKAAEWQARSPAAGLLRDRVLGFLLANSYLGIPTLTDLAANFHTSARSLQRQLQAEGASYQTVVEAVRKTLALHYLQAGAYPLKEVAYMLGYNELSAFSRAFKRWTSHSPAHYAAPLARPGAGA